MALVRTIPNHNIFVFGSNLAGIHGAGAALYAKSKYGAVQGKGVGPTGKAYAIPTKGKRLEKLPRSEIAAHVRDFIDYATLSESDVFLLTKVGTGLAGYGIIDIAPLFRGVPENVIIPEEWEVLLQMPNMKYVTWRYKG